MDDATRELSEAKAEIARLTAERDEWQRQHDLTDHRCFALAQRAENAEAEIARLREPFEAAKKLAVANAIRCEKAEAEIARLREALEPFVFGDSDVADILWGELPNDATMKMTMKLSAYRAARAALKPDTGEKP